MSELNVVGIDLKNVLGIQELSIKPDGNIIEISGGNGQGKTSILEGVKAALGLSEHSSLIRNGEKKAEIVLDLGDMLIKKTYTASGAKVDVQGRVMGTDELTSLGKPAAILKNLINPNAVDPVRLLTARPKELLDHVLQAIPMKVSADRMSVITGRDYAQNDNHALAVIGAEVKDFTEKRRDTNRDLKSANTTIEQLEGTITDEADIDDLKDQITENNSAIDKLKTNAGRAARTAGREFKPKIAEKDELIQEIKDKILDLQCDLDDAENARTILVKEKELKEEAAFDREMAKEGEYLRANERLHEDISRAAVHNNTRTQVAKWREDALALGKQVNAHNKALTELQAYKEELCENLPMEGLELTDGMLSMNGIPFGQMNTAARVDLVIELAKLTSGKLGIVVLDNSENLDPETYALFLEKAAATDLTFVVARVTEGELNIK